MGAKLYHVELSYPSQAARLMLEHKGVEFRTVTILPGIQAAVLRMAGLRRRTRGACWRDYPVAPATVNGWL